MMHKDWVSIEELPYHFQGHKKLPILTRIERFQIVTPVSSFESIFWLPLC